MSPGTASWVATRSHKVRASATVVADVADARLALDATDPEVSRAFLYEILHRAQGLNDGGISVADAADVLGISEPTVRNWLTRGVLERVDRSGPTKITESSLGETLAAVTNLRELKGDKRKMRLVLDALEDRRVRAQLEASIAELGAGDLGEVDPADIRSLFE